MTFRYCAILVLALTIGPAVGAAAAADSAESMYTKALARERVLRDAARHPTMQQLRSAVRAYENIVRRFPRSGYSDNALWQGANLSLLSYELFGEASDRRACLRLLAQLRKGYPSSSLVARVDEVVRRSETLRAAVVAEARAAAVRAPVVRAVIEKPAPAGPAASSNPGLVAIRDITRTPLPNGMRVSIEMDGESNYHAERITGPDRVFFDLKGTTAAPALVDATLRFDDEVVREIRLGRHPENTTRVVMDMAGVESYSVFTLYEPFRLVIDFKAAAPSRAVAPAPAAIGAPPPAVAHSPLTPGPAAAAEPGTPKSVEPAGRGPELEPLPSRRVVPPALNPAALPSVNADGKFSLARQLGLGISRIVIDAGHGGTDPGSMANGVREAELALDIAERLQKLLEKQTQIEVVMTRSTDVFIPLDQRTVIANKEGADLFLSIHANTARNVQARGVETYFLNFAPNPEAEAVAARENATSGGTMHNLPGIVKAIALNNKIDESRDFAASVQQAMVQRLAKRNKQVKDRGVKQAPFVVLIGAEMPSVLAEISFLTNKQEARLLKTAAYRQQIAEALLDGVLRYQQSVKKMKSIGTAGTTRETPAVGRE